MFLFCFKNWFVREPDLFHASKSSHSTLSSHKIFCLHAYRCLIIFLVCYLLASILRHHCFCFRQQQLQFRPPFEEIRSKYYREIRKFISIPKNFKGLGDNQAMFQSVIENNSSLYESVYSKAEVLFSRLLGVQNQFKDWVVLGTLDMEQLAEEHLHVIADWELNIKMIKIKGKEAEKLPLYARI